MRNKTGQIGTTLTWVFSFGLIVFIIVSFLIIASTSASIKHVRLYDILSDNGKNEISLSGEKTRSYNLELSKEIGTILRTTIQFNEQKATVFSILREYNINNDNSAFDSVSSWLKNEMDVRENECYALCFVFYDKEGVKGNKRIVGSKCPAMGNYCMYGGNEILADNHIAGEYETISEEGKINIKLYVKDENIK